MAIETLPEKIIPYHFSLFILFFNPYMNIGQIKPYYTVSKLIFLYIKFSNTYIHVYIVLGVFLC